jgi:hypothetical protein
MKLHAETHAGVQAFYELTSTGAAVRLQHKAEQKADQIRRPLSRKICACNREIVIPLLHLADKSPQQRELLRAV